MGAENFVNSCYFVKECDIQQQVYDNANFERNCMFTIW